MKRRMVKLVGVGIGIALVISGCLPVANAAPKDDPAELLSPEEEQIARQVRQGLENFDILDYEAARDVLLAAIAFARRNNLERTKVTASAYVALGVVYFSGFDDKEKARLQFEEAVESHRFITIPLAYKTEAMNDLLDAAKEQHVKAHSESPTSSECAVLEGIAHVPPKTAPWGQEATIAAQVNIRNAKQVRLYYRSEGALTFVSVLMRSPEGCQYLGTVPAVDVTGPLLHYYIAAYDANGRVVANVGSATTPNVVELLGDPPPKPVPPPPVVYKRWFVQGSIGTAGGYVTGKTEKTNEDVACCLAQAWLHSFLEAGQYLSPQWRIALAFRLGFLLGANRPGHATAAPSALVRVHYDLSPKQSGWAFGGAMGLGILRHTVKLEGASAAEGDTDTVATGPVLVGGSVSYAWLLGGPLRLIAELNGLIGVPIGSLGGVDAGFGVNFDANLGLGFLF